MAEKGILFNGEIIGGLALWQHLLASEALDSEDDDALTPKDGE